MAPIGILWGLPYQRQTKVILAAAAVAGLEIETPPVEFRVTNRSPEFLGKFPFGKVPSFENDKGFRLCEGAAIARYVSSLAPESGLLGKNADEAALVDQWVHFGETEVAMFTYIVRAIVGGNVGPYNKEMHVIILEKEAHSLKFLDERLAASTSGYLISDTLTLADISVAAVAEMAAMSTCGAAERALYPNVFAHYEKVTAHPKVKEVFGEVEFVKEGLKVAA